jgi:hypothetical protein
MINQGEKVYFENENQIKINAPINQKFYHKNFTLFLLLWGLWI